MNSISKLLNDLSTVEVPEIKNFDISKKEDRDELRKTIKELKENGLFSTLFSLFVDDEFLDSVTEKLDEVDNVEKELEKKSHSRIVEIIDGDNVDTKIKEIKPQMESDFSVVNPVDTKIIIVKPQLEITEIEKQNETEPELVRPSQKVSTQTGLQIHRLVQEYIDTMIKPYNPKNGGLDNNAINDAYAGLYEFACWIVNK